MRTADQSKVTRIFDEVSELSYKDLWRCFRVPGFCPFAGLGGVQEGSLNPPLRIYGAGVISQEYGSLKLRIHVKGPKQHKELCPFAGLGGPRGFPESEVTDPWLLP